MSDPLDAALDLLRRLDPKKTSENLSTLCSLVPDLEEDLLASVDQPLEIKTCKATGRDYLVCDYNRDGDSTRSPWSNEYEPPLSDGTQPSDRVRKMEVLANDAFDTYRDLYYEGGISSVYFWDIDDGFAGVVLLKKVSSKGDGGWDSIHVFEAIEGKRGTCQYKLTSTVILHMQNKSDTLGEMNLGGNMTRQVEQDLSVEDDASHIPNIGRMVEDMEFKMRNLLQEVYFGKTKDIVNDLRSVGSLAESQRERSLQSQVVKGLSGRV